MRLLIRYSTSNTNKLSSSYNTNKYLIKFPTTPFVLLRSAHSISGRSISDNNPKSNNRQHLNIPKWPTSKNPTPYEIFNIDPSKFDIKKLKRTYHLLARAYHPDSNSQKSVNIHGIGNINKKNEKIRLERFKKVNAAYTILNDSNKRSLYDRYRTGWESVVHNTQNNDNSTRSHRNTAYYGTDAYWKASNWEDYEDLKYRYGYNPYHKQSNSNIKTENEDFYTNKWTIVCALIFLSASITYLQLLFAIKRSKLINDEQLIVHNKCLADLNLAYENYGFGTSQEERIKRFLFMRNLNLHLMYDNYGTGVDEKEDEILKKYNMTPMIKESISNGNG